MILNFILNFKMNVLLKILIWYLALCFHSEFYINSLKNFLLKFGIQIIILIQNFTLTI